MRWCERVPPPAPPPALQTAALALGGPQEVPFSDGGRSWYTAFTRDLDLIQVRPGGSPWGAAPGRSPVGALAAVCSLLDSALVRLAPVSEHP